MTTQDDLKKALQHSEIPKIRKESAIITSDSYKNPRTIPLTFHFEPAPFESPDVRLRDCQISKTAIDGKDIYIFDDFFLENEADEMRAFTESSEFLKSIYADQGSKEKGEEPAKAMDNKEKWKLISNPSSALKEIYKFFNMLAYRLDADVATLPWELFDGKICSPSVATNRVDGLSAESQELGKHEDYNTEKGIAFGLPKLYSESSELHSNTFTNGAEGKPWLVSLMLYTTDKDFRPEYGLGTVFCTKNGKVATKAECRHMRFVLFEGDIVHGIEKSQIPTGVKASRVSYVFKLTLNPKKANAHLKQQFAELMQSYEETQNGMR